MGKGLDTGFYKVMGEDYTNGARFGMESILDLLAVNDVKLPDFLECYFAELREEVNEARHEHIAEREKKEKEYMEQTKKMMDDMPF